MDARDAQLVAFRTSQSGPGGGLGDMLQVYDVAAQRPVDSGAPVVPCIFAACDPRTPYRVGTDTVTFLSYRDGNPTSFILQQFNVRQKTGRCDATHASGRAAYASALSVAAPAKASTSALNVLGDVPTGICVGSGDGPATPCTADADCAPGTCAARSSVGTCVRRDRPCRLAICGGSDPSGGVCSCDPGDECEPTRFDDDAGTCTPGDECAPAGPDDDAGACKHAGVACVATADCTVPEICEFASDVQRPGSPFTLPVGGGQVFTSVGRCLETIVAAPCPLGTSAVAGGSRAGSRHLSLERRLSIGDPV